MDSRLARLTDNDAVTNAATGVSPGLVSASIALRATGAADRDALFARHAAAFQDHIERIWGWDEAWQREDFARLFIALPPCVVVYEEAACGYLQTQRRPDAIHVVNIALDAEFRGRGIGGQLVDMLKQSAARERLDVTLAVFRTNNRASSFYRRRGFVVERMTATHEYRRWPDARIDS